MSVKKPNSQQQAIINERDHNIVVSASAGTGKTTTLTDRLISHIEEGNSITDYLVISFTDTAAQELKDRIALKLKKAMAVSGNKDHYKNQIAKIPLAQISTIHSFCLEVIRNYGYVLGIDPDVAGRLADDGKIKELKNKALKTALDPLNNSDLFYRYEDRSESIENIKAAVEKINQFTINLENYDEWKKNANSNYDLLLKGDLKIMDIGAQLNLFEKIYNERNDYMRHLCGADEKKISQLDDFTNEADQLISTIREEIKENNYDKFLQISDLMPGYPSIRFSGSSKLTTEEDKQRKKYKQNYDDQFTAFAAYNKVRFIAEETKEPVERLLKIAENYQQDFDGLKEAENLISFDDMLKIAKLILDADNGKVAKIYRERFKEIMVDEYQDTNIHQEGIISSIAKENNVLRVGDIKQSIFRFQNARPEMMKNLIVNHGDNDRVLKLQYNYRSAENIINFSNYVFNRLMNVNEGTYDPDSDDLLIPEVTKGNIGDKIRLVNLPYEGYLAKNKQRFISEYIVSEICRIKKNNKDVRWSDFVVLVRSNTQKRNLKRIFDQHNVPVYTTAKNGFFDDPAVSGVVSLLELILQDTVSGKLKSRIAAMNVLTGPMFGISYDDIALDTKQLEVDPEKEGRLNSLVKELKEYKDGHTLSELLNQIFNYENFYMEKIDSFDRNNLDSLYQLVLDFEKNDNNLQNLMNYLSGIKTVDRSESSSFSSKEDVVQILTIHKSKGAEFKYVFLADYSFQYNSSKDTEIVSLNEKNGIAAKAITVPYRILYKDNPYYSLIRKTNQTDDFAEELRLLYVAITRAKTGLYVVSAIKDTGAELSVEGLYKEGYTNMLRAALRDCPPEVRDLYEEIELDEEELKQHNESADARQRQPFLEEKYMDDMGKVQTKAYSPSALEEKDIFSINFNVRPGANRGTLMHKAVELLKIREVSRQDIDDLGLDLVEEDKDKILSFYDDPFTKELQNYENHHEYPFIFRKDGSASSGIIDLLSLGDDICIIDFKSDKNTSDAELINTYKEQLKAYRDVVSRNYSGKNIRTMIYSFELQKYVEVPTA